MATLLSEVTHTLKNHQINMVIITYIIILALNLEKMRLKFHQIKLWWSTLKNHFKVNWVGKRKKLRQMKDENWDSFNGVFTLHQKSMCAFFICFFLSSVSRIFLFSVIHIRLWWTFLASIPPPKQAVMGLWYLLVPLLVFEMTLKRDMIMEISHVRL